MSKNACIAVGAVVAFMVVGMTYMTSGQSTAPSYGGLSRSSHMDVFALMVAAKDLRSQQFDIS
jgi:hypothetical protein